MMITQPVAHLVYATERRSIAEEFLERQPDTTDADDSAVFGGRACYQSWDRPYDPTAADFDYIRNAVHDQAHYSIAEHASFSFYIVGVSRSLTHELVRHRHFAYSQLSQRYVDSSEMDWVCPPEYLDEGRAPERAAVEYSFKQARELYEWLTEQGMKKLAPQGITGPAARKQARQAARSVLPNSTETRIVVTGNSRAWMEAMSKRYDPAAEPEIRRLFGEHLLPTLKDEAPYLFSTFKLPE